jgi:hypothetical protein
MFKNPSEMFRKDTFIVLQQQRTACRHENQNYTNQKFNKNGGGKSKSDSENKNRRRNEKKKLKLRTRKSAAKEHKTKCEKT